MKRSEGKKLLIIGGAFQHKKVVDCAKKMGITTYVVDYLPVEKAPAKQSADYHFEIDIYDTDKIVDLCKKERIDGVLASHLDAAQIPYCMVCQKLGYPCFGTIDQFRILTDKTKFIECCQQHGVDVIPQYSEKDFDNYNEKIDYPIFVKPCDSRGSRGQTICYEYKEVKNAIEFAKKESKSGKIIIEKYMKGMHDFSITCFFIDGIPYLVRTGDRVLGDKKDKMDKSAIFGIAPSKYSDYFIKNSRDKFFNMLKSIGIKNGPVFMQGFITEDNCYCYDPGLRFPGIEYDSLEYIATGFNTLEYTIEFALTGEMPKAPESLVNEWKLNGHYIANAFVVLKPGRIKTIRGLESLKNHPNIKCIAQKYFEGDVVGEHWNVNQRFGEIDILTSSREEMKKTIDYIFKTLEVLDEDGNDMKISILNSDMF